MQAKLNLVPKLFSEESINLVDKLKLNSSTTLAEKYDQPATIVNLIVSNVFVIAGVVIFGLIIGAGYSFLQNTGKGKEQAREMATGAVVGFIVMFSAYWIVQIIGRITGANIALP